MSKKKRALGATGIVLGGVGAAVALLGSMVLLATLPSFVGLGIIGGVFLVGIWFAIYLGLE